MADPKPPEEEYDRMEAAVDGGESGEESSQSVKVKGHSNAYSICELHRVPMLQQTMLLSLMHLACPKIAYLW